MSLGPKTINVRHSGKSIGQWSLVRSDVVKRRLVYLGRTGEFVIIPDFS